MIAWQRLTATSRVVRDQELLGRVDRDQRDDGVSLLGNDGDTGKVVYAPAPDSAGELIRGHGNPEAEQLDECLQRRPWAEPPACDVNRPRIVGEARAGPNRLTEPGFAVAGLAQGVAELGDKRMTDARPGHDITVSIGPVAIKARRC